MGMPANRIETFTDVHERDGSGIEVFENHELVIEIFRDDSAHSQMVTLPKGQVSLEMLEAAIQAFRARGLHKFLDLRPALKAAHQMAGHVH
ncbi:MAG: hypothetical protein JNJ51_03440 [Methylobacillus glycogenes]|nr:hypothetical protein [Methylobacillus glycogenes]